MTIRVKLTQKRSIIKYYIACIGQAIAKIEVDCVCWYLFILITFILYNDNNNNDNNNNESISN